MGSYERGYYIKNWNFDPLKERIDLDEEGKFYRYQTRFKIKKDPEILKRDLYLFARVDIKDKEVANYVVWSNGKRELPVKIVHTIIFEGSLSQVSAMGIHSIVEKLPSKKQRLIDISPEEHFVALKSFVKGIAERGLLLHFEKLLENREHTYPLRKKLLWGLYKLDPLVFLKYVKSLSSAPEVVSLGWNNILSHSKEKEKT